LFSVQNVSKVKKENYFPRGRFFESTVWRTRYVCPRNKKFQKVECINETGIEVANFLVKVIFRRVQKIQKIILWLFSNKIWLLRLHFCVALKLCKALWELQIRFFQNYFVLREGVRWSNFRTLKHLIETFWSSDQALVS